MKKNNLIFLFCSALLYVSMHSNVNAEGFIYNNFESAAETSPTSCSQYRNSNTIQVDIVTDYSEYLAGDPAIIWGSVINQKDAPINNLDIQAVLVKRGEDGNSTVVDKFNILEDEYLDGMESKEIMYTYLLPFNIAEGDYEIRFTAIQDGRFTFLETYDQTNGFNAFFNFSINSSNPTDNSIVIDRGEVTLNEKQVPFFGLFSYDFGKSTVLKTPLINDSDEDKNVQVTYKIFSGQESDAYLLEEITEDVVIPKNSSKTLTQNISIEKDAVYAVSIEAEVISDKDASVFKEKVYEDIRFAVDSRQSAIINFSGIAQYPLLKDTENNFYACLYEAGTTSSNEYKIESILYDFNDKEISRAEYQGAIDGNQAIAQSIMPEDNISEFYIVTSVYDSQSNLVDTYKDTYTCNNINPEKCFEIKQDTTLLFILVGLVTLILLIGLLAIIRKHKKNYEI